jgi:hypothetical protein
VALRVLAEEEVHDVRGRVGERHQVIGAGAAAGSGWYWLALALRGCCADDEGPDWCWAPLGAGP